jgi:excinuclease ABC subunit A
LVIKNTAISSIETHYPWRGESMGYFRDELVNKAYKFDFPIHKASISNLQLKLKRFSQKESTLQGLNDSSKEQRKKIYKIQNRDAFSRYRNKMLRV